MEMNVNFNHYSGPLEFAGDSQDPYLNLNTFYIRDNFFDGSVPTLLSLLQSVNKLDISSNLLTGTLPLELIELSSLIAILCSDNKMHGHLTNAFSSHSANSRLVTVDISGNGFTGSLPVSLFNSSSLVEFIGGSNCFTGSIPSEVCNAVSMVTFDLNGMTAGSTCRIKIGGPGVNYLYQVRAVEGTIPSCLFSSSVLRVLSLASNGIRSPLGEIANNSMLMNVSLAYNRIHGSIPMTMKQYGGFMVLDMGYNQLSGTLDEAAWFINGSMDEMEQMGDSILSLERNRLNGTNGRLHTQFRTQWETPYSV